MICRQGHLARAIESLGAALVPDVTARHLRSFAAGLPDVASGHILECRLAGGACDYSLVLTRGDGGLGAFADRIDDVEFWQDTARLLAATQDRLRDAGLVWLEFDTADGGILRPGFFVAPGAEDADARTGVRLAQALSDLFGLRPRPDVAALTASLPGGARLKQIGFMAGRGANSLRLVIDGIPASGMLDCLAAVDWPGAHPDAMELVDLAKALAGDTPCRLDLDLGAGVEHGVGIEVLGHAMRGPDAIQPIISAGLCSVGAAQALAANLERRTLVAHRTGHTRSRLDFGLNHLKLFRAADALHTETKAYFSLLMLPDFSDAGLYNKADTSGE